MSNQGVFGLNIRLAVCLLISMVVTGGCSKAKDDSGSNSKSFSTNPPVVTFDLAYDCKNLKDPQVTNLVSPPGVTNFKPNIRRVTLKCTPTGGTPKDEYCTQEVWAVGIDYDYTNDFRAKWENRNVGQGQIYCACTCVKVVDNPCERQRRDAIAILPCR